MNAIMPELVPKEVLVQGNALRGLSGQGARVIGPLAGGLIVTAAGAPWAFALDAATFAFSFLVFLFSTPPTREGPPRKALLAEIREGIAFTFSASWLWVSILGFAFTNSFFFAGFTVALPILVLKVLAGSAATFGLIGSFAGLGEIVGGLLIGNVHLRRPGIGIYVFSAMLGLAFIGFGIAPWLPLVVAAAFLFNVAIVASNTLWDSALQKHVPGELIGRVSSVDAFGSYLIAPIAPIAAAAAIGSVGPGPIFVVGGAISFLFWMGALAVTRSIRHLD
jgi:hypothetical protein